MLEIGRQKNWKGFFFSIGLWYVIILVISITNTAPVPFENWLIFYTKYSWPNFLLVYLISIWIIPNSLHKKKFLRLILLFFCAIFAFVIIRFLNNTFWDSYYYTKTDLDNLTVSLSWTQIVGIELVKGIQFSLIGFFYRFSLDRLIMENEKNELEKIKLKAEISMLRYQLNPHFLFNSINSIYYLAISNSRQTPEALIKLSEILRYQLDTKEDRISVQNELSHIERIISFEIIRFPNEKIIFHNKISPGKESLLIPPFILTTFVENAFKHGKQGTIENPIEIILEINAEKIYYQVKNPVDLNKPRDLSRNGTGFETLGKRLAIFYPDKHVLSYFERDGYFISFLEISYIK